MKYVMLVFAIFAVTFVLLGYSSGSTANKGKIHIDPPKQSYNTLAIPHTIYVDPETRVQYIVFSRILGSAGGVGITPRLDAEGKPMLAPEGVPLR